MSVLLDQG